MLCYITGPYIHFVFKMKGKWHLLGYLGNKKVFLKIPFPLYEVILFGSVITDLALPSLTHINYLINMYLKLCSVLISSQYCK